MACLAFPLCPLAITEAERGIPGILKRIRAVFEKVGLKYNESVVVRITGCPNGCARPYMAELRLVGDGPNSYQLKVSWTRGLRSHGREGPVAPARHNLRLFDDKETYEAMDGLANLQNKSAHQLSMEVIGNYVASGQDGKSINNVPVYRMRPPPR
ncbi:hypothetical protein RIF29_17091 [Crotalaria pallida]|uniref:Uncharacterized protein n=1 Tax=Crotalaria pallida TaxID=3830 RepID=A0AAN9IF06_CROPI